MSNGTGTKRLLRVVAALVLLGAAGFSGWELWNIRQVYQDGEESYAAISEDFVSTVTLPDVEIVDAVEETAEFVPISVSFEELRSVYKDAVAWIYCGDTLIDYPVVQGADNDYYLDHLPDGRSHISGSIFMDCRSAADFSGYNTILYGHNMKNDSMFGGLSNYQDQAYYDAHPVFYLLTPDGDYKLELISGCTVWKDSPIYAMPEDEAGRDKVVKLAVEASDFVSSVEVGAGDRLVTLSTCTGYNKDARYIVVGVLRTLEEGGEVE